MQWMIMPFMRYADFSGRSQRIEYWMFALLNVIVFAVLGILMFSNGTMLSALAAQRGHPMAIYSILLSGWGLIMLIWWLFALVPTIAVLVRRFHDQDKSGWFALLQFVPYVGGIIVFVFMCLDGTPGPNRFGEDPKGRGTVEVFR